MRKRSKYRPKPVILDAMTWVQKGFAKVTSEKDADLQLRLRMETALESLIRGDATPADFHSLAAAANIATALSRKLGQDWRQEIREGVDALEQIQVRMIRWQKVQATAKEIEAIKLLVSIHDAQLDEARVVDIEQAIHIARCAVRGSKEMTV